jgi:hypothetical protein
MLGVPFELAHSDESRFVDMFSRAPARRRPSGAGGVAGRCEMYYDYGVTRGHALKSRRAIRFAGAIARASLAAVVLLVALEAGKTYVFCRATQTVMRHSCCPAPRAETRARTTAQNSVQSDCCQARSAPSLEHWTPSPRTLEVAAAAPIAIPHFAHDEAHLRNVAWIFVRDPSAQTGPPKARVHVRLMVFHI